MVGLQAKSNLFKDTTQELESLRAKGGQVKQQFERHSAATRRGIHDAGREACSQQSKRRALSTMDGLKRRAFVSMVSVCRISFHYERLISIIPHVPNATTLDNLLHEFYELEIRTLDSIDGEGI